VGITAAREEIAAVIAAAGVAVTLDPRNVQPPSVVVDLPTNTVTRTGCVREAQIPVVVCGVPPGNADACRWIGDTADRLFPLLAVTREEAGEFSPAPGVELPAWTMYVTAHL
jgi:hypothetical protein